MDSPIELVSFVTRAENRVEVLLALASASATRPELQDETGIPRATLSRILADFRDRDLLTREGHEYRTTKLGDHLASELDSLFESVAVTMTLQELGQWPAVEVFDLPVDHLGDADLVVPDPTDPTAPIRRAERLLENGSRVRIVTYNMIPGCLLAVWRAVTAGQQTFEGVLSPEALSVACDDPDMAVQTRDLYDSENASLFVYEDDHLPALFVVDETVFFVVTDDAGTVQGHVETTDETVRAWAEATIDEYVRDAERVSPELLTA